MRSFPILITVFLIGACHQHQPEKFHSGAIYIAAHHDDWQLFMGRDFFNDVSDTLKEVILIHTTVACTGKDFGSAREAGALASVRYAVSSSRANVEMDSGYLAIEKFKVAYYRVNNVVVFFLRLPDGNINGQGFDVYGNESMEKLRTGEIKSITTADSLNHIKGWDSLVLLLRGVVYSRFNDFRRPVDLHIPDTLESFNPDDHSDHIMSAHLALEAFPSEGWKRYFYSQYYNEFREANLIGLDSIHQRGLFDAYDNAVTEKMGYCTTCYTDLYQKLCRRLYRREAK